MSMCSKHVEEDKASAQMSIYSLKYNKGWGQMSGKDKLHCGFQVGDKRKTRLKGSLIGPHT